MGILVPGATNFFSVGSDGHTTHGGTGLYWLDERGYLVGSRIESPSSDIVWVPAEACFEFKNSCSLVDYLTPVIQRNHDAKHGADLAPHLHWEQTTSAMPNWLIQYRYQIQGAAKTTTWTSIKHSSNAFTYVSGTLNQITLFPAVAPPSGDGVSDILQMRIIRDVANTSTLFTGAEVGLGSMYILDFDLHKECDSEGSNTEYGKT